MARLIAGLFLLLTANPVLGQSGDSDVDQHRHRGDGARILVLRDYHLDTSETANGPIVVMGGAARIDGHAADDVVVLGGSVRVGPEAVVDGDLIAVGGNAIIDPKARIYGEVSTNVIRFPDIDGGWDPMPETVLASIALAATILRLLTVFLVAAALTLIAPALVRHISWRAADRPASSAAIGLACQVGFIPALIILIVTLAVTVVGIPLIGLVPFLVAAAGVAGTAGFTAVAARIGARLRGTTVEASNALFVDVTLGIVVVSAVSLSAHLFSFGSSWGGPAVWSLSAIGIVIEYVVWTMGIGAACATLMARWNGPAATSAVPPPTPPVRPATA